MTIQQLEYILAVDQFRHFARAAEYCRVTQPTLSAMIQKLEDELGVKLFDRTVQPVCPTTIGQKVIDQARVILAQAAQVKDIISEDKQSLSGVFRLGVLPTIAPYLLPRFFPQLMEKYPENVRNQSVIFWWRTSNCFMIHWLSVLLSRWMRRATSSGRR